LSEISLETKYSQIYHSFIAHAINVPPEGLGVGFGFTGSFILLSHKGLEATSAYCNELGLCRISSPW
jgi:hypothetical protein